MSRAQWLIRYRLPSGLVLGILAPGYLAARSEIAHNRRTIKHWLRRHAMTSNYSIVSIERYDDGVDSGKVFTKAKTFTWGEQ